MNSTPIRMWKVSPKSRMNSRTKEPAEESTTESVSERRGDFSSPGGFAPTMRSPPASGSPSRFNRKPSSEWRKPSPASERRQENEDAQEEEEEDDVNVAIKRYLQSGMHKNDPKKIAEMVTRLKAKKAAAGKGKSKRPVDDDPEKAAAKSIFEKYGGGKKKDSKKPSHKGWRPKSAMEAKKPTSHDDYEEEEEEEEEEANTSTKRTYELKTWDPKYSGGRGNEPQGSSSYFKKFARDNLGGSFRRPRPKVDNEQSKIAKDIFSKYSKPKKGEKDKDESTGGGGKGKLPATSFSYSRNKYKSKQATESTSATSATEKTTTEKKKKYTPRFTTKPPSSGGGRDKSQFWPTPRPFHPKRMMTGRTTPSSTARSTAGTTARTRSSVRLSSASVSASAASPTAPTASEEDATRQAEAATPSQLDTSR